jgi:hypothetical protein
MLFTARQTISYQKTIEKVLTTLIWASLLYFFQKLAIENIAADFHKSAYQERITANAKAIEGERN